MALKTQIWNKIMWKYFKSPPGLHVPQGQINGDLLKYGVLDNQWSQLQKIICIRTDFCKWSDTVYNNQPQKWGNSMGPRISLFVTSFRRLLLWICIIMVYLSVIIVKMFYDFVC